MDEKIIETRTCKHCGISFDVTDKDREFYDKISPVIAGKRYAIPDPKLCPDCRLQRRLSFRNERKLYHRPCDKTGKTMISMFAPGKQYTVYSPSERYADTRDARDYGTIRDENQSFFGQFDALLHRVPQIALLGVGNYNCDYNNFGGYNKNCYLCFDYGWLEDCSYLARSYKCKNCFDLSYSAECEWSSNLSDCFGCVKCDFCVECDQCFDCGFCCNCAGCSNCFLCSNLVNKQYHIEDKPYSKEEYEKVVGALKMRGNEKLYADFLDIRGKAIHKYANIVLCERVTGDYLKRCKNCKEVYGAKDTEDCAYVTEPMIVNNLHDDVFSGNNCSFNLETIGCEGLNSSKFCFSCWSGSSNLMYCHFCLGCHHCFGCAGLRNQEYCILNKQYTKEEYEYEVGRIIGRMIETGERGEFFPASVSPFCYNESLCQEFYPLSKEEALKKGFARMDQEYSITVPEGMTVLHADKIPGIQKVDDKILNQAIQCEISGRPFRIIKSELEYYRSRGLDLPHKHPDQRHYSRMALRNPRKLWDRKCMKCGIAIKTSYAPERKEVVYCEACYNKEVYG